VTANVKYTVAQRSQTFYETHIVYLLTLFCSACSSRLQSEI